MKHHHHETHMPPPQQNYGVPPPFDYNRPPQQGYPQQQGYNMPQQGYGMPQQSYGMPQQSHHQKHLQQGYDMPQQQGYDMPLQQGYGMPQQSYGMPQQPTYGTPSHHEKHPSHAAWLHQYSNNADPDDLRTMFESVDTDQSGDIDIYELEALLDKQGDEFSSQEVSMMMGMFDTNHKGRLSFDEFVQLMGFLNQTKNTFNHYDQDGDGVIDQDQISHAMAKIHGGEFVEEVGGHRAVDDHVAEFTDKGIPFLSSGRKDKKTKHGKQKTKKEKKGPGIFTMRNFVILAVSFGVMRTLYRHNKLPGFTGGKFDIMNILSNFTHKLTS